MLMSEAITEAINILNAAAGPAGGTWKAEITRSEEMLISHDLSGWSHRQDVSWMMPRLMHSWRDIRDMPFQEMHPGGMVKRLPYAARIHLANQYRSVMDFPPLKIWEVKDGAGLIVFPESPLQIWPVKEMVVLGQYPKTTLSDGSLLAMDCFTGLLESFTKADFDQPRVFATAFARPTIFGEMLSYYEYILRGGREMLAKKEVEMAMGGCG